MYLSNQEKINNELKELFFIKKIKILNDINLLPIIKEEEKKEEEYKNNSVIIPSNLEPEWTILFDKNKNAKITFRLTHNSKNNQLPIIVRILIPTKIITNENDKDIYYKLESIDSKKIITSSSTCSHLVKYKLFPFKSFNCEILIEPSLKIKTEKLCKNSIKMAFKYCLPICCYHIEKFTFIPIRVNACLVEIIKSPIIPAVNLYNIEQVNNGKIKLTIRNHEIQIKSNCKQNDLKDELEKIEKNLKFVNSANPNLLEIYKLPFFKMNIMQVSVDNFNFFNNFKLKSTYFKKPK